MRGAERRQIRRRITYRSVANLVGEYARCVTKGGCTIKAPRAIDVGSSFVFEMCYDQAGAQGELKIQGEVVAVRALDQDFEIGIAYRTTSTRNELEAVLAQIRVDDSYATLRSHPRIPVNLIASDREGTGSLTICDLSRGGMQLEGASLAGCVVGAELSVEIAFGTGVFPIRGRVVWSRDSRVGVAFEPLGDMQLMVVDGLLRMLRPSTVVIAFDRPPAPAQVAPPSPEVVSIVGMLGSAAAAYLRRLLGGSVTLEDDSPSAAVTTLHEPLRARVAITGDIEGELVIEVEPALCDTLARTVVGEAGAFGGELDPAMIVDALSELATMVAGCACDATQHACTASVSAPFGGVARRHPGDVGRAYGFGNRLGRGRLIIVAHEVAVTPRSQDTTIGMFVR